MKENRPRFPVYIVSKGRWERRLTSRALHALDVPHFIVVEESEHAAYAAHVGPLASLLILDKQYQRDYETCDDLGDSKSKGPGPARNFAWDHAIASGATWHWVMDDNIGKFFRLYRNKKIPMASGVCFRIMEDYVLRFTNVAMAGPNYDKFAKRKQKLNPIILNTRIYSCNLIRNDVPFRWRARYNEDTDLSLRMLKAGWCTVQFNAFLQNKATTQTMKGGNTAEFYEREGTLAKSQMQVRLHPDVSRLVWKFSRPHHTVSYKRFKRNRLIRRKDVDVPEGVNEYGMVLERRVGASWKKSDG